MGVNCRNKCTNYVRTVLGGLYKETAYGPGDEGTPTQKLQSIAREEPK